MSATTLTNSQTFSDYSEWSKQYGHCSEGTPLDKHLIEGIQRLGPEAVTADILSDEREHSLEVFLKTLNQLGNPKASLDHLVDLAGPTRTPQLLTVAVDNAQRLEILKACKCYEERHELLKTNPARLQAGVEWVASYFSEVPTNKANELGLLVFCFSIVRLDVKTSLKHCAALATDCWSPYAVFNLWKTTKRHDPTVEKNLTHAVEKALKLKLKPKRTGFNVGQMSFIYNADNAASLINDVLRRELPERLSQVKDDDPMARMALSLWGSSSSSPQRSRVTNNYARDEVKRCLQRLHKVLSFANRQDATAQRLLTERIEKIYSELLSGVASDHCPLRKIRLRPVYRTACDELCHSYYKTFCNGMSPETVKGLPLASLRKHIRVFIKEEAARSQVDFVQKLSKEQLTGLATNAATPELVWVLKCLKRDDHWDTFLAALGTRFHGKPWSEMKGLAEVLAPSIPRLNVADPLLNRLLHSPLPFPLRLALIYQVGRNEGLSPTALFQKIRWKEDLPDLATLSAQSMTAVGMPGQLWPLVTAAWLQGHPESLLEEFPAITRNPLAYFQACRKLRYSLSPNILQRLYQAGLRGSAIETNSDKGLCHAESNVRDLWVLALNDDVKKHGAIRVAWISKKAQESALQSPVIHPPLIRHWMREMSAERRKALYPELLSTYAVAGNRHCLAQVKALCAGTATEKLLSTIPATFPLTMAASQALAAVAFENGSSAGTIQKLRQGQRSRLGVHTQRSYLRNGCLPSGQLRPDVLAAWLCTFSEWIPMSYQRKHLPEWKGCLTAVFHQRGYSSAFVLMASRAKQRIAGCRNSMELSIDEDLRHIERTVFAMELFCRSDAQKHQLTKLKEQLLPLQLSNAKDARSPLEQLWQRRNGDLDIFSFLEQSGVSLRGNASPTCLSSEEQAGLYGLEPPVTTLGELMNHKLYRTGMAPEEIVAKIRSTLNGDEAGMSSTSISSGSGAGSSELTLAPPTPKRQRMSPRRLDNELQALRSATLNVAQILKTQNLPELVREIKDKGSYALLDRLMDAIQRMDRATAVLKEALCGLPAHEPSVQAFEKLKAHGQLLMTDYRASRRAVSFTL